MAFGKNTKEYQTVKKNYPNLSNAMASVDVIEWACERLLAAGLITDGQKDAASNRLIDAKNRASTVTGLLLNKVEQDTKYFQMLVDVLQQDMDTFGTVLKQMGVTVDDAVASGSTNGAAVSSTSGGNTNYPCTPANLEIELNEVIQPYQFGLHLGMAPNTLQQIEKNHPGDVARQRTEVIIYWDRNFECTWEKVADALKKLGGYGKLEKKLRQMHTRGPSGSPSARLDLNEEKVKDPVVPKLVHLKFSDDLSPNDLVAWLSQELVARGLKLDDAVKDKLIEQEINGGAFKDLSKDDLIKEMGFKLGPCKNILKIIEDVNK